MNKSPNIIFLFLITIFFVTPCCQSIVAKYNAPMSKKEIDKFIADWIEANKTTFDWKYASDDMIYSALVHGDGTLSIGYTIYPNEPKLPDYDNSNKLPERWIVKKEEIIQYVLEKERKYRRKPSLNESDLRPRHRSHKLENHLPNISLYVTNPSVISELRKDKTIRYIEPGYYPKPYK